MVVMTTKGSLRDIRHSVRRMGFGMHDYGTPITSRRRLLQNERQGAVLNVPWYCVTCLPENARTLAIANTIMGYRRSLPIFDLYMRKFSGVIKIYCHSVRSD